MKAHVDTITNLLLGAAYADKRLEGREVDAIRRVLNKILGTTQLPAAQAEQMRAFNPAKFDVQAAGASLAGLSDAEKRKVLELVATINDSDDTLDLAESEYLAKVARAMGVPEDAFTDLTLQVLDEDDLEHFFDIFEE